MDSSLRLNPLNCSRLPCVYAQETLTFLLTHVFFCVSKNVSVSCAYTQGKREQFSGFNRTLDAINNVRSEERRVGKKCKYGGSEWRRKNKDSRRTAAVR